MSSQRFCLRWNNHQSNLLSVFDQLLHAETFTDVTLAVEGQLLKAHKMVLSACSPYFQALFVNHQEKHPIVILKDVPYSDMKSLLDFMYRGEVSVDQERLTAFLRVAESLRIKGLTEVNEEKCDIPALTNSLLQQQQAQSQQHMSNSALTPPPQLHRINPYLAGQKRPGSMPSGGAPPNLFMPLLGNALLQPKRKRGRPRKLSGSSNDTTIPGITAKSPPTDMVCDKSEHQLLRGSPEIMEMKMGTESFQHHLQQDDGCTSGGEDVGEALLIDEGDDAPPGLPSTPSKDSDTAITTISCGEPHELDVCYEESVPIITVELVHPSSYRDDAENEPENHEQYNGVSLKRYLETQLHQADEALITTNSTETDFNLPEMLLIPKQEMETQCDQTEMNTDDPPDEHHYVGTSKSEHRLLDEKPAHRSDLLEYLLRDDGSVVCKMCGEILQSRTHWYRHKYKFHSQSANVPGNPSPMFQCEQCFVFFKSRKGYIGHMASRHPENDTLPIECVLEQESQPSSLSLAQISTSCQAQVITTRITSTCDHQTSNGEPTVKVEPLDTQVSIEKTERTVVTNYSSKLEPTTEARSVIPESLRKHSRHYKDASPRSGPEWEERRSREERLVADIIARVRRECEAAGGDGPARRGYTRKTTTRAT